MVGPDEDEQPEDDSAECASDPCGGPYGQAAVATTYYSRGDTTSGWDTYDTNPAGSSVRVVSDPDRGPVNQFVSDGTHNGFRLRKTNLQPWGNTTQVNVEWWQQFSTPFVIYVSVNTTDGLRYLTYTARDSDDLGSARYIHHGLGGSASDGTWRQFKRDLHVDLKDAQPWLDLLSVNAFLVRGSGKLDDIGLSATSAPTGTWERLANMPTARSGLTAAAGKDGRIYAIGGGDTIGLDTVEAYTPGTNTWTTVASMPSKRAHASAVTGSDGRIYVIGGRNSGYYDTVEVYTPSTNSWATAAKMPHKGSEAAVLGFDSRIYALGGGSNGTQTVDVYTPATNTWTTKATMPRLRNGFSAVTGTDGRIYVMAGSDPSTGDPIRTVDVYTPSTSAWTTVADMPQPNTHMAVALGADGRLYALGGDEAPRDHVYTPSTNTWTITRRNEPSIPTSIGLSMQAAVAASGRIYELGGGAIAPYGGSHFVVTAAASAFTP